MKKEEEMLIVFQCEIHNIKESLKILELEINRYKGSKGMIE